MKKIRINDDSRIFYLIFLLLIMMSFLYFSSLGVEGMTTVSLAVGIFFSFCYIFEYKYIVIYEDKFEIISVIGLTLVKIKFEELKSVKQNDKKTSFLVSRSLPELVDCVTFCFKKKKKLRKKIKKEELPEEVWNKILRKIKIYSEDILLK